MLVDRNRGLTADELIADELMADTLMHYMITAVGADRPGIVAAVTAPLAELGCNLEDSSSTILRGHFAMMVVVAVPDSVGGEALLAALRPGTEPLGLTVTVAPVAPAQLPPLPTHLVSVYGADRPGIVRDIARFMAERQIDITDLQTRLLGTKQPVYVALLEVAVPSGADAEQLQAAVTDLAQRFGVDVTLRPVEADSL